jgi:uncharacterized protein YPO0396
MALQETLKAMPGLRDQIKLIVQTELTAQQPDAADTLEELQQQYAAVSKKITRLLDIDSDSAIPEVKVKILALKEEQRTIENRIKEIRQAESGVDPLDTDQIVGSIMVRLEHLADELPNLPVYQLRQLLAAMTHTLTADMVTREVEMVLRLPSAAVNNAKTAISELCLQQSSGSSTLWQAQFNESIVLTRIRCDYARISGKQCFTCRRLRLAA